MKDSTRKKISVSSRRPEAIAKRLATRKANAKREILRELGFSPSKTEGVWLCKFPSRRSSFSFKEGIVDVYESNNLSSIANAFFQAGVDTGRLEMSDKVRKVLHRDRHCLC